MSERRACWLIGADRKTIRYRSRRPDDAALRARLRELAAERRRFGYRRLHVLLRKEGLVRNRKRTQRLYREEGLAVRRRKGRKRAVGTRSAPPVIALPNQRWSLDFVHDQLASGRRIRVLNIVDDVTRECLAAIPDTSISGRRVIRELEAIIVRRGIALMDDGRRREARSAWLAEDLPARFKGRILPIDPAIAQRWGDLMAHAHQSGFALSVMDGYFAATALDRELVLATRNTKDFAPLGVPLLNPWTDEGASG
jgi:transposase InsO family protein